MERERERGKRKRERLESKYDLNEYQAKRKLSTGQFSLTGTRKTHYSCTSSF